MGGVLWASRTAGPPWGVDSRERTTMPTGNQRVSGNEGTRAPQRKSIGLWLRGLRVQSPSLTLFSGNDRTDEVAERFLSLIDRSGGPDACWPWTGLTDREGYGHFTFSRRSIRAHRIACMLAHGEPPEPDSQACHDPRRCSSRRCCNPAHLRWDSPAGNQHDVRVSLTRRGERNPKAKLTDAQAREIWRRRGECGYVLLARKMGLPEKAVRHVLDGTNWAWATGAARPAGAVALAIANAAGVAP